MQQSTEGGGRWGGGRGGDGMGCGGGGGESPGAWGASVSVRAC